MSITFLVDAVSIAQNSFIFKGYAESICKGQKKDATLKTGF